MLINFSSAFMMLEQSQSRLDGWRQEFYGSCRLGKMYQGFVDGFGYMCKCVIDEAYVYEYDVSMSFALFCNEFGTKLCFCCGFFRCKVMVCGVILQVEGILNILPVGNGTEAKSFVGIYNQNVGITVEFLEES